MIEDYNDTWSEFFERLSALRDRLIDDLPAVDNFIDFLESDEDLENDNPELLAAIEELQETDDSEANDLARDMIQELGWRDE